LATLAGLAGVMRVIVVKVQIGNQDTVSYTTTSAPWLAGFFGLLSLPFGVLEFLREGRRAQ